MSFPVTPKAGDGRLVMLKKALGACQNRSGSSAANNPTAKGTYRQTLKKLIAASGATILPKDTRLATIRKICAVYATAPANAPIWPTLAELAVSVPTEAVLLTDESGNVLTDDLGNPLTA